MGVLIDLLKAGRSVEGHRPWPRAVISSDAWRAACDALGREHGTLIGLWGEIDAVHMALLDGDTGEVGVLSVDCPDGRFPSVGAAHAPAIRLERAIHDLFGLEIDGAPDPRPWLDHGRWDAAAPLAPGPAPSVRPPLERFVTEAERPSSSARSREGGAPATETPSGFRGSGFPPARGPMEVDAPLAASRNNAPPYAFLPTEGESLHQIPVGPVHAGIIEPGHFRFTASGETIVRLEERLGYVHKGIEGLMAGSDLDHGAKLAGRTSGDSTVAYALAFAHAVEAALAIEVPERAQWLRALMAELERIANHFGDVGAICNDASFSILHAHCGVLRELVLRFAGETFGHRLVRDVVVPGGVTVDLLPQHAARLAALVAELRTRFAGLVKVYDNSASLQDRTVGAGRLRPELARRFGAGGYVGRASGRSFDARRSPGYTPYDRLRFDVPVLKSGDVNARVWIRIREVEQSLSLIEQILAALPAGPLRLDIPSRGGEGMALVEGFRGDILAWVRLRGDGRIARCHLRDPSWFQWPLLEAAIEGNIVADFPLCNKSFNCSYSGHDL